MSKMLLIPLDDTVVFPTMDINLPVDATGEDRVLLVPRHDGTYAKVGTIARVTDSIRLPGGGRGVSLESLARGVIAGAAEADAQGRLRAEVTEHPEVKPVDGRTRELRRAGGSNRSRWRSCRPSRTRRSCAARAVRGPRRSRRPGG